MNKQTDAIFAKMVEKYAKTSPENGEITPEIMEEIKMEMNKSWFVQNLKETCERLEMQFKYALIGKEPKKKINAKVSSVNFDKNKISQTYIDSAFERFMEQEPKIYRLQLNLALPNYKPNTRIFVRSPNFYEIYLEFTKYEYSKLTAFVQLKDKNDFPEGIEIEYEFIGKEAYEIMIELHKQEIERLESEIKKLN